MIQVLGAEESLTKIFPVKVFWVVMPCVVVGYQIFTLKMEAAWYPTPLHSVTIL
jgi:hypothetical protein